MTRHALPVLLLCLVAILVERLYTARTDNAALLSALDCGVPHDREVLHIAPRSDGRGYDCAVSRNRSGRWMLGPQMGSHPQCDPLK